MRIHDKPVYGDGAMRGELPPPVPIDAFGRPPLTAGARSFTNRRAAPMENNAVIDPAARLLRVPGALSATVDTGPEKIRSGFGNGDCLLMAPDRGLFAVADASERHPRASRKLVTRLHRHLAGGHSPEALGQSLAAAFERQKFTHKSTLSGLVLTVTPQGLRIDLFHGGDSMILIFRDDSGEVLLQTRPDMHFAGRIRQPPDVTTHTFDATAPLRIVLATDGFAEVQKALVPSEGGRVAKILPPHLIRHPPEDLAGRVRQWIASDPGRPFHDDIAFMAMDPLAAARLAGPSLTLGGTSPRQEAEFVRTGAPSGALPRGEWQTRAEILRIAGIRFLATPKENGQSHGNDSIRHR